MRPSTPTASKYHQTLAHPHGIFFWAYWAVAKLVQHHLWLAKKSERWCQSWTLTETPPKLQPSSPKVPPAPPLGQKGVKPWWRHLRDVRCKDRNGQNLSESMVLSNHVRIALQPTAVGWKGATELHWIRLNWKKSQHLKIRNSRNKTTDDWSFCSLCSSVHPMSSQEGANRKVYAVSSRAMPGGFPAGFNLLRPSKELGPATQVYSPFCWMNSRSLEKTKVLPQSKHIKTVTLLVTQWRENTWKFSQIWK